MLIGKSKRACYFTDRHTRILQKLAGSLHFAAQSIFVRRYPEILFENTYCLRGRTINQCSKLLYFNMTVIIGIDKIAKGYRILRIPVIVLINTFRHTLYYFMYDNGILIFNRFSVNAAGDIADKFLKQTKRAAVVKQPYIRYTVLLCKAVDKAPAHH